MARKKGYRIRLHPRLLAIPSELLWGAICFEKLLSLDFNYERLACMPERSIKVIPLNWIKFADELFEALLAILSLRKCRTFDKNLLLILRCSRFTRDQAQYLAV